MDLLSRLMIDIFQTTAIEAFNPVFNLREDRMKVNSLGIIKTNEKVLTSLQIIAIYTEQIDLQLV